MKRMEKRGGRVYLKKKKEKTPTIKTGWMCVCVCVTKMVKMATKM